MLRALAAGVGGEWRVVEAPQDTKREDSRRFIFEQVGFPSRRAIGKVRPAGKNRREIAVLRELWAAGLRPPGPFTVPEVLTYIGADDCLVTEFAPGTLVADILRSGVDALEAMRRSGEWLAALHGSFVRANGGTLSAAADELLRWREELIAAVTDERTRITEICDEVRERVEGSAWDSVPAHGDFHPEHVFVDDTRVTAIDFDRFGLRPRGDDVGMWLARTATIVFRKQGSFAASRDLRREFLTHYRLPLETADVGAWLALYLVKSVWFGVAKRKRPHLERLGPLLWAASRSLAGDLSLAE